MNEGKGKMAITVGTDRISPHQRHLLELARGGAPPEAWIDFFRRILITSESSATDEQLHPDWLSLFERQRPRLRRSIPRSMYEQLEQVLAAAQPYDPSVAELDPDAGNVSFLLGAGASASPSGIPTVKELLPDLLTRARRLDRDEVTKVADFCDTAGIDNIEDLLTAAQLSEFCTRNPAVLKLVEFLIFRDDTPEEYSFARRRRGQVDVSSVAFLQDTLQVLFGLCPAGCCPRIPTPRMTPSSPIY